VSVSFSSASAPAPITPAPAATPAPYKVKAKPVTQEYLSGPGSLRVQHLMYLYGCSQSAVYRQVAKGQLPPPTGHNPRAWWSNEVIRTHLETGEMPPLCN
jgi:predicted DNA-binding transcriptional regulator AlpA